MATSIALAVTLLAGPALAQDQAAIEKLVQLNKKALDDYDTLEWESAKRTLLEALTAGSKAGLDNHPVMARTYPPRRGGKHRQTVRACSGRARRASARVVPGRACGAGGETAEGG